MIALQTVEEIGRLLAEGKLSQRKIADRTRVSRGTVAAIAAGRLADRRPPKSSDKQQSRSETADLLQRCPGCGGMVAMPCRLCRTLSIKANAPKPPAVGTMAVGTMADQPLELNLNEEHRARYQQVRARRMEAELAALRSLNDEQPLPEESEPEFEGTDFCHAADIDSAEAFEGPEFEDTDDWNTADWDELQVAVR